MVTYCRQEALEAAISEKDAHLALLEMSGIRNERQATEVELLRKDKKRLMERLKREVLRGSWGSYDCMTTGFNLINMVVAYRLSA